MRRLSFICVLALAACAAAVADAQTPEARQTNLRGYICQHALDPGGRAISITAVMRPLPGTLKMQMRFELLKRASRDARAISVAAPGLKRWITPSDPTLGQRPGDRWVVHHPVVDLDAPDLYRLRVSFRWFGQGGTVVGTIARRSRTCYQPELRPDLAVPKMKIESLGAGVDRYSVPVANLGKTASGPFDVQLSVGAGQAQQVFTKQVPRLGPHNRPHDKATVRFQARACTAAEPITVIADPQGQVDDSDRTNNTFAQTCPGASTPGTARKGR